MTERTAHIVRGVLETEIVEGRLPPGAHLDEQSLANRFGVSRTPIREALHGLASSRLVELRPRRGAFVRQATAGELVEMFEMMGELEASCGRFACRRITKPQERRLQEQHERCRDAANRNDLDDYYAENELFHAAIYDAAGNSVLAEHALSLQARLKPFRRHQLRARGRMGQSLAEHEEIVEAIRAGDQARAEAALRDHIVVQGEKFSSLVAALDTPSQRASA